MNRDVLRPCTICTSDEDRLRCNGTFCGDGTSGHGCAVHPTNRGRGRGRLPDSVKKEREEEKRMKRAMMIIEDLEKLLAEVSEENQLLCREHLAALSCAEDDDGSASTCRMEGLI